MTQHYSDPKRESDPHSLPDIETFYIDASDYDSIECFGCQQSLDERGFTDSDEHNEHVGWYWWPCFPGCLPDGDPNGPFDTEEEALADAREGIEEEE